MIQIGTLSVDFEQRDIRRHGASLRIGARALDILEVLHRASGSVVSKDDIMDAVWPGLIVEENRLQVHVATLRKALGASRDLIKTVPGRGYLLVASASPGPDLVPAAEAPAVAVPPAVAPLPDACASSLLAPLVGRDAEIAQIVDMLERTPVITLVGAGGIGKTSLAVRVAHGVRSRAHERVLFVELARASTRDDMLIALAAELGLDTSGVPAIDRIGDAFATSRCLLVLDNAEHIVDLVASLVETLTSSAGSLRVLVTSREPLHISAEAVLRMSPLAVPDGNASAAEIVRCSAVELFLERVRAAAPDCAVDEAGVRLIGDICRRLDGLPLAIELAAARAAVLGIDVLAAHLDDHFRLLTGGFRTALPRHQTLQAMYDWSYRLLGDAERLLLRWLGVFRDGFSIEAVREVVRANGPAGAELLETIAGLVSKSLVILETAHGVPRYRLLTTTRAYAQQQLDSYGEGAAAARAHATYFLALFRRAAHDGDAPGSGPEGATRLDAVRRELGNLRVALDWAFSAQGDAALGIALTAVAVPCLFDLSLVDECRERARVALDAMRDADATGVSDDARVRVLAAYAAALAHTAGSTQVVHDAWSEVHALGFDAAEAELPSRES